MKKILMNEKQLNESIKELASKLDKEIKKEKNIPIFISVMKGSLYFFQDLTRNIKSKIFIDYIRVKSWGGTKSSGQVQLLVDSSIDLKDRVVYLVDDVVDSGSSIKFLKKHLQKKHPKKIYIVSLFDKINARKEDIVVDYSCKVLEENYFLMGYGFDYYEIDRNVPYVYAANKNDVKKLDEIIRKDYLLLKKNKK